MIIPHLFANPNSSFSSRRDFLRRTGSGAGLLGLTGLLSQSGIVGSAVHAMGQDAATNPLAPKKPHFPAEAKSVIWLFMNGGQSQVDTWDHKPELAARDGQELPGFDKNTGFFTAQVGGLMKSPFTFQQYGNSGTWASEIMPNLSRHVDDMAFVHSCFTQTNNHSPALFEINTGLSRMGYPCAGAWVTYGLGTENQNLPAFVVMYDTLGRGLPKGNASNWGAGFLPGVYQGTALNAQGQPINNLARDLEMTDAQQRGQLDLMHQLNELNLAQQDGDSELAARIQSYELAYRMQMAAPEVLDIAGEPESVRQLYGIDEKRCGHFARQCLMARRLVEQRCTHGANLQRRNGKPAFLGWARGHCWQSSSICRGNGSTDRRADQRPEAAGAP